MDRGWTGSGQGLDTNKKGYKGEEGKHDPPAGDEQSLFDEEATADLHESERELLGILEHLPGWPFAHEKDLKHIRDVAKQYPKVDLVEQARWFSSWLLDNPLKKKSNPRLRFHNWIKNADKRGNHREDDDGYVDAFKKKREELRKRGYDI